MLRRDFATSFVQLPLLGFSAVCYWDGSQREVARCLAVSIHESGGEQPDLVVVVLGVVGVPLHGETVAVVSESYLFERLFKVCTVL